ncbi:MAG: hypothetical protein IT299_00680 [Dehalococcoidia bacterium]|nr:hypothetical protein [Dehalococcoidia bacterium]
MSPPLLRRLAGLLGRTTPTSSDEPADSEPQRRRRRRGGRGRGGGGTSGNDSAAPSVPAPAPRPPQQERAAPPRSRTPDTSRANGPYERRRAPRRLDQPLPEDIAFRPPAEGGDRSILPSRRRPPPGLKATKRVLVAGSRFVPRGPTATDDGDDIEADDERQVPAAATTPTEGEASDQPARKRRRGRRGGRGRRRPDGTSQPSSDASEEA